MSEHPPTPRLERIWISPGHDFSGRRGQAPLDHGVRALEAVEAHAGRGLLGDRYYDFKPDYKGQVTLVAAETWEALRAELGHPVPDPAAFRRNFLTRGIELNGLIGRRFRLGTVELVGTEEARPCDWMDVVIGPGAREWMNGRGGLRCRLLTSGWFYAGSVELEVW
jgi:MOSC domain-containing protein YiiM